MRWSKSNPWTTDIMEWYTFDEEDQPITVFYRWCKAEPDVGIMRSYVEVDHARYDRTGEYVERDVDFWVNWEEQIERDEAEYDY
jgi:hypothetical protein